MTDKEIVDFHVLERKRYNLLKEVLDLSKQLGDSIDRNDQVTMRMLLSMRQDPISKLEKVKEEIDAVLGSLSQIEQDQFQRMLAGVNQAETKAEQALQAQSLETVAVLNEVLALDKRINQRVAGENSVYLQK